MATLAPARINQMAELLREWAEAAENVSRLERELAKAKIEAARRSQAMAVR